MFHSTRFLITNITSILATCPFYPGGTPFDSELIGCYMERPGRALPELLADSPAMTPQLCRQLALNQSLRFYATADVTKCYGGRLSPSYLPKSPGGCNSSCPGAPKLACGGAGEIHAHSIPVMEREYVGCFLDPSTNALTKRKFVDALLTPEMCRLWAVRSGCSHYAFQGPDTCMCGDGFLADQRQPYTDGCTQPCGGNPSRACGGPRGQATSVYRLSPEDPTGAHARTRTYVEGGSRPLRAASLCCHLVYEVPDTWLQAVHSDCPDYTCVWPTLPKLTHVTCLLRRGEEAAAVASL